MSNRKNQNSILVLATLGVYFGLVLVGATPQVLASAAMTRQFDVKDEIEVKDDLDTKPDGEKALEQFASTFEELYRITRESSFEYPDKALNGAYNFNYFVSVNRPGGMRRVSPAPFNGGELIVLGRNSEHLRRLYDALLPREDKWHEKLFVQFGFGATELSFKITIVDADPSSATLRASAYEKSILRRQASEVNFVRSLIFEASKVIVENNKVIIVTRLPRAGLDSLLANDAK